MIVTPSILILLALSVLLFNIAAVCMKIASVRDNRNESDHMAAVLYTMSGYIIGAGVVCIFVLICLVIAS